MAFQKYRVWVLTLFAFSRLEATTVLPLTIAQMTEQADRVFIGHCLEVSSELDEYQLPSSYIRFEVLRGIKGVENDETILIKQFGIEHKVPRILEGEKAVVPTKTLSLPGRSFEVGKDYLLFLYPDSRLGFTSPVGGGQGKLEINPTDMEQLVRSIERHE